MGNFEIAISQFRNFKIYARGDSPLSTKSKEMKLHELRPAKGSTHKVKRIGRGDGSGHGGTSTKGGKGQQARTGYKRKMAHEGG